MWRCVDLLSCSVSCCFDRVSVLSGRAVFAGVRSLQRFDLCLGVVVQVSLRGWIVVFGAQAFSRVAFGVE